MEKQDKIYVAGHGGMVGSALVRKLKKEGYENIIVRTHKELDLSCQEAVEQFFAEEKPDYVFLAAAKVGGIHANEAAPADFLRINVQIEMNVMWAAYKNHVKKLCFIGSGSIYPVNCPQPMKEEYLLSGPFERKNEGYGIAKMVGTKMCEYLNRQYGTDFIAAAICNIYGPGDNYSPESSHVVPALVRKFHEGKIQNKEKVTLYGTGTAVRSFLYADDVADACYFLMEHYSGDACINVGHEKGISIGELGKIIKEITGFEGEIAYDSHYPDGSPEIRLDTSRLSSMGWKPVYGLRDGLKRTYEDYLDKETATRL